MHLVEQYALACSSKAGSPYIHEKYFPLPFDKYITFSPFSKPSKNYDYWRDVLSMLLPDFQKLGIVIVQVGGKEDKAFEGCYNLPHKKRAATLRYRYLRYPYSLSFSKKDSLPLFS